jgi:hypothetical protein
MRPFHLKNKKEEREEGKQVRQLLLFEANIKKKKKSCKRLLTV